MDLTDPLYSVPLTTNQFEDFVDQNTMVKVCFALHRVIIAVFLNEVLLTMVILSQKKLWASNNERVYTDGTKSGTIKNSDTSFSKIELTNQTGNFTSGDLLVNRTQFLYTNQHR